MDNKEIEKKICEVLDKIRPYLENDGGSVKFNRYENSFLWLKDAGVALPTYCADEPKTPLMLSKSRNLFKLFHCDVGLLASMYMDNNLQIKILNKDKDINFGCIYENAIAEELVSKGFDLYYYKNNKFGEIDFLIENKGVVIPFEIKSGKNYKKHNALDHLLSNNFDIPKGYILSNNNIEIMNVYFILFLNPLLHINNSVNIGANNAQSQNKESTINPKIHISFKNLFDTLSFTIRIIKHISNVNNIFKP